MSKSDDDYKAVSTGAKFVMRTQYHCPKHGNIGDATVNSTIVGLEACWCLRCIIEFIDKNIPRAVPIQSLSDKPDIH